MGDTPKRLEPANAPKAPQKPNKRCKLQNQWWDIDVTEPCFLVSKAATPSVIWYVDGDERPVASMITEETLYKSRLGVCFLSHPGKWNYYFVAGGSSAVDECFVTIPVNSPEAARIFAMLLGVGIDSVNVARWGDVAVDAARNADADADFAKALVGPVVNSRLGALRIAVDDYARLYSDFASALTGQAHNSWFALLTNSTMFGRDTSDNTLRAIEARAFTSTAGITAALYGLLTNSRLGGYNNVAAGWEQLLSERDISGVEGSSLHTLQARDSGFNACFKGRRFRVTDEGASVTASNGFTATAPRFTIENGATNELIIKKIVISCLAAGTTNLRARVILDPDARYSSGGTAGTVGARNNMNGGSATAGGYTYHYGGITATAADADEREVETRTIVNVTGNSIELTFEDGLIVPASGTLLIYVYDAGATGTAHIMVEGEEANVQ